MPLTGGFTNARIAVSSDQPVARAELGDMWLDPDTNALRVWNGSTWTIQQLQTPTDTEPVRVNSRNYASTSGDIIAFQARPAANAGTSGSVYGCQISPRVNSGVALSGSGSIIGAHIDAYLKGTAAGTVAGDVRGLQVELVTDDAGTRTVSGDVVGIRLRAAFSASTLTGNMTAIKIEKAESQTNSQQWDYVMELTGDNGTIWNDDFGTEVTTIAGAIKVRVNEADRWIPLYSGAPSA